MADAAAEAAAPNVRIPCGPIPALHRHDGPAPKRGRPAVIEVLYAAASDRMYALRTG